MHLNSGVGQLVALTFKGVRSLLKQISQFDKRPKKMSPEYRRALRQWQMSAIHKVMLVLILEADAHVDARRDKRKWVDEQDILIN